MGGLGPHSALGSLMRGFGLHSELGSLMRGRGSLISVLGVLAGKARRPWRGGGAAPLGSIAMMRFDKNKAERTTMATMFVCLRPCSFFTL